MPRRQVISFFVLLAFALAGCEDVSGTSSADALGAKDACQDWAKEQLKAPSTADFSDVNIKGPDDGPWKVKGSVDSENSFGAKLRTTWTCTVRLDGDYYRGNAFVADF